MVSRGKKIVFYYANATKGAGAVVPEVTPPGEYL